MALTGDRNTPERDGKFLSAPVLANAVIFAGALVVLDSSGWAKPGVTATGLVAAGRADARADNTGGANGAISVTVRRGIFRYANSADTDEITKAEIGDACYIVDDQTVAKTSDTGARSVAGTIIDVDSGGVWVEVGLDGPAAAPGGALLAANNFSDIGTVATARANLGVNKHFLQLLAADLAGGNAAVYRAVAPIAGTITKIRSVLEHAALATGDATLTAKIGAVGITNGVITITQSGSAAGDVDVATPTAQNTVSAGDVISVTVGGTNDDTDAQANVVIEITY